MEIILAVIAAIIIIAILGLLLLKKKQQALSTPPVVTLNTDSTTPSLETATAPVASADSHALDEISNLIQTRHYQEAEGALKKFLIANPSHSEAILKLLQLYGITNNFSAFNKLHEKIHQSGDAHTIEQADYYRSLIDMPATAPTEQAADTQAPQALQIDTLTFDLEPTDSSHTAVTNPTSLDTYNLSLNSSNASHELNVHESAQALDIHDPITDDLLGDFNLDLAADASTQSSSTSVQHGAQPTETHDNVFDFSLEGVLDNADDSATLNTRADVPSTASPAENTLLEDFGMEDLLSSPVPETTPNTHASVADFELSLDTAPATEALSSTLDDNSPSTANKDDHFDLLMDDDFGLSATTGAPQSTVSPQDTIDTQSANAVQTSSDALNLDELALDTPSFDIDLTDSLDGDLSLSLSDDSLGINQTTSTVSDDTSLDAVSSADAFVDTAANIVVNHDFSASSELETAQTLNTTLAEDGDFILETETATDTTPSAAPEDDLSVLLNDESAEMPSVLAIDLDAIDVPDLSAQPVTAPDEDAALEMDALDFSALDDIGSDIDTSVADIAASIDHEPFISTDDFTVETTASLEQNRLDTAVSAETAALDGSLGDLSIADSTESTQLDDVFTDDMLADVSFDAPALDAVSDEPTLDAVSDIDLEDTVAISTPDDDIFADDMLMDDEATDADCHIDTPDSIYPDDSATTDALAADTPTAENPTVDDAVMPDVAAMSAVPTAVQQVNHLADTTADSPSITQLDDTQITLNLAKQYLDLGEHDSAKRLLAEVLTAGNQSQQSTARTLLARLS